MMKCEKCDNHTLKPLDLLEGWVEVNEPVSAVRNGEVVYEPSGFTEIIWDTSQTIGYGCDVCGWIRLIKESINIAGATFEVRPPSRFR